MNWIFASITLLMEDQTTQNIREYLEQKRKENSPVVASLRRLLFRFPQWPRHFFYVFREKVICAQTRPQYLQDSDFK